MLLGGAENAGLIGKVGRFTLKTGNKDKLEEEVISTVNENPADQVIGNRFALSPRTKVMRDLFNANLKNQGKDLVSLLKQKTYLDLTGLQVINIFQKVV